MPNSPFLILMLEDESDRLTRFDSAISKLGEAVEWRHWRTAEEFIAGFKSTDRPPGLICLDHDLFTDHPDDPDPGDGRDVAEFMATQPPCCHVIIHSSNAHAADSMFFTLSDANWDVEKIAPLGQDWIESYWWDTAIPWLKNAT